MSHMFNGATNFNGNISNWVINTDLTSLEGVFSNTGVFNQNISGWDVSGVTNMSEMFLNASKYAGNDITDWDVSESVNLSGMFLNAPDMANKWGTHPSFEPVSVGTPSYLFFRTTPITQANIYTAVYKYIHTEDVGKAAYGLISDWDISGCHDLSGLFENGRTQSGETAVLLSNTFKSDIRNWNTSNVTNMSSMFYGCQMFESDLSGWNTSNVTDMNGMFRDCRKFDSYINTVTVNNIVSWDVSKVTDMAYMFCDAQNLSGDISDWNTSNVTNMSSMFYGTLKFNQNINTNGNKWIVSKVTNMSNMFGGSSNGQLEFRNIFNQDISGWDVSKCTDMEGMFAYNKAFNHDITKWAVGAVNAPYTKFKDMFKNNITDLSNNPFSDKWKTKIGWNGGGTSPPSEGWPSVKFFQDIIVEVSDFKLITNNDGADKRAGHHTTLRDPKHATVMLTFTTNSPAGPWEVIFNSGGNSIGANITVTVSGYTVTATYPCSSADTEGDISYIVKYFPYGGGDAKIFLPNSNDIATTVIFDKTPPTLTTVSIVSNNSYDNSLGKPGDTVTLTFTASEQLKNSPVITFKSNGYGVGGPITTTNIINTTWISQYTIRDTDIEGLITFTINFWDLSNIAGVPITETTNSTGVIFSVNNKVVISADGVALINNSITDSLTHELIFTITEPTNDFTIDNIITTNNTLSNFKKDPSGNNKKYTATSVSIGGWNYIRIEGGTFRSLAGNMNVTTDFSWKFQINLVDSNIRDAVNTWVSDSTKAIDLYGHIINWDTSNITDMSGLFKNKTLFNNDITNWNTTKVTDMSEMFMGAAAFNQNIETVKNLPGGGAKWNTDKVSSMRYMFYGATAFNQDLSSWGADLGNSDITGFSSKFGGKNNIYNINKTIKDTWEFKL